MTRLSKRATIHLDNETIRKVPVYRVDDRIRDVVVPLYRTSYDTVEQVPETVDVDWAGYQYFAEYDGVTDDGDPIYTFELETPE